MRIFFLILKIQFLDYYTIEDKIMDNKLYFKFTNNIKYNTRIFYNSNNLFNFKNFISFLYLNSCSLSKLSFHLKKQTQVFTIFPFKVAKVKNFTSQLKKWIEDFYLGGYDNYSKSSATMISCSINFTSKH